MYSVLLFESKVRISSAYCDSENGHADLSDFSIQFNFFSLNFPHEHHCIILFKFWKEKGHLPLASSGYQQMALSLGNPFHERIKHKSLVWLVNYRAQWTR